MVAASEDIVGYRINDSIARSSRSEVIYKKGVLKIFAKFTGKHLCQSFFLKKRLWHRCFPVNFSKFLRTPVLTEHLRWLFLHCLNP